MYSQTFRKWAIVNTTGKIYTHKLLDFKLSYVCSLQKHEFDLFFQEGIYQKFLLI